VVERHFDRNPRNYLDLGETRTETTTSYDFFKRPRMPQIDFFSRHRRSLEKSMLTSKYHSLCSSVWTSRAKVLYASQSASTVNVFKVLACAPAALISHEQFSGSCRWRLPGCHGQWWLFRGFLFFGSAAGRLLVRKMCAKVVIRETSRQRNKPQTSKPVLCPFRGAGQFFLVFHLANIGIWVLVLVSISPRVPLFQLSFCSIERLGSKKKRKKKKKSLVYSAQSCMRLWGFLFETHCCSLLIRRLVLVFWRTWSNLHYRYDSGKTGIIGLALVV